MSSIPAITMGAFRNDLKPSIADNRNFTRRLACSTILFRYLQQRILAGLFQQKLETRHGPSNPWNRVRLTSSSFMRPTDSLTLTSRNNFSNSNCTWPLGLLSSDIE